jgi:hypothetical protein
MQPMIQIQLITSMHWRLSASPGPKHFMIRQCLAARGTPIVFGFYWVPPFQSGPD